MEDSRINRIENKVDLIVDKISSIDVTLGKQHVSLQEHIRRTELLEKDLAPIKKHVAMVHGGLKLLGAIVVFIGALEGIFSIVSYLKG